MDLQTLFLVGTQSLSYQQTGSSKDLLVACSIIIMLLIIKFKSSPLKHDNYVK